MVSCNVNKVLEMRFFSGLRSILYNASSVSSAQLSQDQFVKAAREGNLKLVEQGLSNKPKLLNGQDRYGYTALMAAAQEGHIQVVRYLIDAGAREDLINRSGHTAVELVASVLEQNVSAGRKEKLQAVLEYLANPERPRNTITIPSPDLWSDPPQVR